MVNEVRVKPKTVRAIVECSRCHQTRPVGEDLVLERAWDILHDPCGPLTWEELKARVNEYAISGDMVKSAIAAARASQRGK